MSKAPFAFGSKNRMQTQEVRDDTRGMQQTRRQQQGFVSGSHCVTFHRVYRRLVKSGDDCNSELLKLNHERASAASERGLLLLTHVILRQITRAGRRPTSQLAGLAGRQSGNQTGRVWSCDWMTCPVSGRRDSTVSSGSGLMSWWLMHQLCVCVCRGGRVHTHFL